jgi:hypothetical protein
MEDTDNKDKPTSEDGKVVHSDSYPPTQSNKLPEFIKDCFVRSSSATCVPKEKYHRYCIH